MPQFPITISGVDKVSPVISRIEAQLAKIQAPVDRMRKNVERLDEAFGMSRATKGLREMARQALMVFDSITRLVAPLSAIAGAASAAGLLRMATTWGHFGRQITWASQRLGVPIKQLHTMEGAADLAGSSSAALVNGLRGLRETVFNMDTGRGGQAYGLFNMLHLDKNKPTASLFLDVVE